MSNKPIEKGVTAKQRTLVGFYPCGPILQMLQYEFRGITNKSRKLEDIVAKALGPKYPEQARRFRILREAA